jgi:DNA-binding response OmpR family regulator
MKILIIEDDKTLLKNLKLSFKKEMFTIDCSSDGKDGVFLFKTNHYDLLILDYHLPSKNGKEVIREIKSENPDAKIILITVDIDPETRKDFFDLGVDDYISKPFSFEELLQRVKAVSKRPPIIQKSIYRIDNLKIDIDKHIVTRNKRSLYLSFKELQILEFLIKNKGKVISRTVLMENIWDINADPFSNTIESHILKLRRKLNPNKKERELIHTIKGRGYKLDLKKW